MGYFDELKARPKESEDGGFRLEKMTLSTPEKGVLLGWGMQPPFVAETLNQARGQVIYVWRGAFSPRHEAPVLAVPAGPSRGVSRDSEWSFGVIRQDEVPADNAVEAFADAAQYPVIGESDKISLAIAQLAMWVPPNYGGPLAFTS